jgi:hypothetical protein
MYPELPELAIVPSFVAKTAEKRKITNLLLNFLDFYISEEDFCELRKNDFIHCNLPETIQDLKFYGYEISLPESAAQYRSEVFPLLMDMHVKAGYYGVQVPAGGIPFDREGELTAEAVNLIAQQVEMIQNAGLAISTVGGSWNSDWTQCIKPQAQAAKLMGSEFLFGPFSTPFLLFPENCYGEAAVKWIKQQHNNFHQTFKNEIGPYLKSLGVIMCEEPLQRFERMPAHLKECTELALREGMEQFSVMIDTCHEFADGAGPQAFGIYVKQLAESGKLNGAHISALHRGKIYESWFNQQFFNEFFGPLFEQGFEGEIAIETFDATQPVVEVAKVNREKFKHPIGVLINQLHYACEMIKDL